MSNDLKRANTLASYITIYHKGKKIYDFTPNHMMFLEDVIQLPHDISAAISDDIEKCFDNITTDT